MNIYLLQLITKLLTLVVMSIATTFGQISEETQVVSNPDKNKSLNIISTIIKYDTIIKYNNKVPSNVSNVLVEGIEGIVYKDENDNTIQTLKEKTDKVIEVGTGKIGEYKGILTQYGPDCATCDGRGYVYCPVTNNNWHNLTESEYYEDNQYGKIRILAADHREFPCGTIIEINNSDTTKTIGIVLDTGSGMRAAYDNGVIAIDIANKTEKEVKIGTNFNTKFSVKRWGW